jgi:agmatine deiminase
VNEGFKKELHFSGMMNRKVKIALIQMKMVASQEGNLQKAIKYITEAAHAGAQIVALPELFTGLYFPQKEYDKSAQKQAQAIPGSVTEILCSLAKKLNVVIVGGSIYEKDKGKYYNTAFVINNEGWLLGKYRKVHIPHDPSFYEGNYFESGNLGFQVFETAFCNVAVLICYDQWFPEAARSVALAGADIIFYPTAIGFVAGIQPTEGDWVDAWVTVQRGHGIANGVHIAAINRVGKEDEMTFFGNSFVSGPFGTVLAHGSQAKEEIIYATCDFHQNQEVKKGWRFLDSRRPDQYKRLCQK